MSLCIRHRGRPGAPVIVLVKLLRDEGIDVRLADAKAEFQAFNSAHIHDIAQMAGDIVTIVKLPVEAAILIDGVRRAVAAFRQRYPDHGVEIVEDNDDPYQGGQVSRHVITDPTGTPALGLTSDPLAALRECLAFSSRDWSEDADLAWLYGIVLGWDDPDEPDADATDEVAARFGWDAANVARLRTLRAAFAAI